MAFYKPSFSAFIQFDNYRNLSRIILLITSCAFLINCGGATTNSNGSSSSSSSSSSSGSEAKLTGPLNCDNTNIASGKSLWEQQCAVCHANFDADGVAAGNIPEANPLDASQSIFIYNGKAENQDKLHTFIFDNAKKMNPAIDCDANCANNIALYIKSLSDKPWCVVDQGDSGAKTLFKRIAGTQIDAPETNCTDLSPTPESLLSKIQLSNAITEIFQPINLSIENEIKALPETNNVDLLSDSYLLRLLDIADAVAEQVTNNFSALNLNCADDRACAQKFVETMGKRAYRRSLENEEINELLLTLFDEEANFNDGIAQLARGLLFSTQTLYRYEGVVEGNNGVEAISPIDKASKLSLLLWDSIPDNELIESVENGSFATEVGFKAQVQRMLEDTRFEKALGKFHTHWLNFSEHDKAEFVSGLRELELVVANQFRNNGSFLDLLTTQQGYVNSTLANIYGINNVNPGANEFVPVPLDNRPGILTRAAFLTDTSEDKVLTTPPVRGKTLARQVMCINVNDPPPNVQDEFNLLPRDPNLTSREEAELVVQNSPSCYNCHAVIDPLAFALENFDGSGRFRETEDGVMINPVVNESVIGAINGHEDFANIVGNSEIAMDCYAERWFTYAFLEDKLSKQNRCLANDLKSKFKSSGGNLVDLITELVNNPAMHYRRL